MAYTDRFKVQGSRFKVNNRQSLLTKSIKTRNTRYKQLEDRIPTHDENRISLISAVCAFQSGMLYPEHVNL
jgi:hypothetical protein